ncbi:hypothetical protein HK405_015171, partial [Cladochytrium tenue]
VKLPARFLTQLNLPPSSSPAQPIVSQPALPHGDNGVPSSEDLRSPPARQLIGREDLDFGGLPAAVPLTAGSASPPQGRLSLSKKRSSSSVQKLVSVPEVPPAADMDEGRESLETQVNDRALRK